MATEFVMPKLGLTMEAGTITEWLASDGQMIAPGDSVLVIETDKVETEVESPAAGVLHRTGVAGESFPCGAVIGYLLAEGEAAPAAASTAVPETAVATSADPAASDTARPEATVSARTNGRIFASPNARRVAAARGISLAAVRGTGPGGRIVSEDVEAAQPRSASSAATTQSSSWASPDYTAVPATAAARLLAELLGVNLRLVPAGRDGQRDRAEVATYVRQRLADLAEREVAHASSPSPSTTSTPTPLLQTPTSVVPLTGMRGIIASRMHRSLTEMAQLTLHLDATMDAVIADRTARKEAGSAPSYTDYVIAAAARALREHPILNAQVTDEGIALLSDIHIGVAVALEDGLLVPVVRHADTLDLDALAAETGRLAAAARAKRIDLAQLEGGTFSISSLGMFGVDGFTPVINAPNVAILGVGRLREEARVTDGQLATSTKLTLSLTWDHRALDGAPAAAFTQRIAALLANPAELDHTKPTVKN